MVQREHARGAGNLPIAVTSFIGRRREISDVRTRLSASRLVTLTGVGGVGKTRLAIEVGQATRRTFADGVWLVDLSGVDEAGQVAQTIASTLGVPDQSARPARQQLIGYLAERALLLVTDNCEHLLDECAVLIDQLLRAAPRLRILATSRQSLGLDSEQVFVVDPLPVPDPDQPSSAARARRSAAVTLFVERASAVKPGFTLTGENNKAVAELCTRLEGIPLAIELAATRLRALSLDQIINRLTDRFALLTGGSRAYPTRQRTLRALFDWSYALCSPEAQLLWARLSVFAREFDLSAAEGVCAGDGLPRSSVFDLVDQLVDQSILTRVEGHGYLRYRMLETIRYYGRERLTAAGEDAAVHRRHRDFYLTLAKRSASEWCGPGQEMRLARLHAEHDNLRTALDWSLTQPDGRLSALELTAALRQHWYASGLVSEGRRWLDKALEHAPEPTVERTNALWVAAWVCLLQGDLAAGRARLAESATLAKQLAQPLALAHVMRLRGAAAIFDERPADAVSHLEQAASEFDRLGDTGGVLIALFGLSMALAHAGDAERSNATAASAIALAEVRGERWTRSYALWARGFATWLGGDPDAAVEFIRDGLRIQQGFNDPLGVGGMVEHLASISASTGDFPRAARLLGAVESIRRSLGTNLGAVFGPRKRLRAECERRARAALGVQRYAALVNEGVRLALPEAIDYAVRDVLRLPTPAAAQVLTRREQDIADLIAQGMSNRRIAESLLLSPRTVSSYVEHILLKLGFTSRTQVAAWVAERSARHNLTEIDG